MAERFLESKTKNVYVGKNAYTKVGELLIKKLPNQKVLLVTNKNFLNSNLEYYNSLIKAVKQPIKECSLSKNNDQKTQIKQLLNEISEEVGVLVFIGSSAFFNAVKIACSIKKINLILMPTKPQDFSYLLTRAETKIGQEFKVCNTIAPMAVFVDVFFINMLKKANIISLFSSIASLQFFILDCTLMNFFNGKTIKSKKLEQLQSLVLETIYLNQNLYNFNKKTIIQLVKNSIKCGLIVESYNKNFLDASFLSAKAFNTFNSSLCTPVAQFVLSLFLINYYKEFVCGVKTGNYTALNLKQNLKLVKTINGASVLQNSCINSISSSQNKIIKYKIDEFKAEMVKEIETSNEILNKAFKIFKRMSLELCFVIEKSLNTTHIKKAICLAPYMHTNNNFLSVIKSYGVLDF